jgi:predicted enzyme related to lactoylglutathione lyase
MHTASDGIDRNGRRHGDVSYVTLVMPDPVRGEAFYGRVLGWEFGPGQYGREQGLQVIPQVGLTDQVPIGNDRVTATVLGYRVDDITTAVERVREAGGTAEPAVERAYGLESLCTDNDSLTFYLHQLGDSPNLDGPDLSNGRRPGDFAYLSLGVSAIDRAEDFYGRLLGWTFSAGSTEHGRQISGVNPMAGLSQGGQLGVMPAYRVDDIALTAATVRGLGGTAGAVDERPYGLAIDHCTDDQGGVFSLLQLG